MISSMRVSFAFNETITDLQKGAAADAPLANFTTEAGYRGMVEALRSETPVPLSLGLPWPRPVGNHFWDYYLSDKSPGDAVGKLCFEKLVPLKLPPSRLSNGVTTSLVERHAVTMKGFYFPYGLGLLITVALFGQFDVRTAGDRAVSLRHDKVFTPSWGDSAVAAPIALVQLAAAALQRLRTLGFGVKATAPASDPFSIVTVIAGDGVDPSLPLQTDSPTHRLLNGLSGWVRDWADLPLGSPVAGQSLLKVRSTGGAWPGDVLYAARRGRAVWLPNLFRTGGAAGEAVGCYHRNLLVASLQTESLLGLASGVEGLFAGSATVPNSSQRLGRLAAGLAGRLYGGAKTYRSDSLRAQIAQSGLLPDVESLRRRFGMEPIIARPPSVTDNKGAP